MGSNGDGDNEWFCGVGIIVAMSCERFSASQCHMESVSAYLAPPAERLLDRKGRLFTTAASTGVNNVLMLLFYFVSNRGYTPSNWT